MNFGQAVRLAHKRRYCSNRYTQERLARLNARRDYWFAHRVPEGKPHYRFRFGLGKWVLQPEWDLLSYDWPTIVP